MKDVIIALLQEWYPLSPGEITTHLRKSRTIVHKYLKELTREWVITKYGKAPHVKYKISTKSLSYTDEFTYKEQQYLEHHRDGFDATWKRLAWYRWFVQRCQQRQKDIHKSYKEFFALRSYIDSLKDDCWLLSQWYEKFLQQISIPSLTQLYYCDMYQLAQFGKSRLGWLAFYAKQSQTIPLAQHVIDITYWQVHCLIKREKYDAVCFVPRSLQRSVQLMRELRQWRQITLPEVTIEKLPTWDVVIPQKSLKGHNQRIHNARETMYVPRYQKTYNKVLLIDDFVWSWATLNESWAKLLAAWLAQEVHGLALVGNIDMTYEVINEV